jgi:hypothetical protein
MPRGGGESPPIPDLGGDGPNKPATMASFAARARDMGPPIAPARGILPTDLLPKEAIEDPEMRHGVGGIYAASQPGLAHKYGVVRNGKHITPEELRGEQPVKKSETNLFAQDRQMIAQVSGAQPPGGSPAAPPPGAPPAPPTPPADGERPEPKTAQYGPDALTLETIRSVLQPDLLNNETQRGIIEARLDPIDLNDCISGGELIQIVPIIPPRQGKSGFVVHFRKVDGLEDMAIKRRVTLASVVEQIDERYTLDHYHLCLLVAAVVRINDTTFVSHLSAEGFFDEELFKRKYIQICKGRSMHMLASLAINYFWFDQRCRRLFAAEDIKNG